MNRGIKQIIMKSFRENRSAEKKKEIINKAAEIFAKKGYEKTTMEEIAAELNMTKGSIYYYFKGKDEILFQCLMMAHSLANEVLSKIIEKGNISSKDKLILAIKEHVKVLTRKSVYATLRQQELLLPGTLRKAVSAERNRFQANFMGIVQEGIDDGTFKKVNLKMVSFAILGAVNWVARWYSPDGSFSPEEIGDRFAEYLVGGLL